MLGRRRDHNVVPAQLEPVSKVMDSLGRIAAEDGHVVRGRITPGEGQRGKAGALIGDGGCLRLVASRPLRTGIPRNERLDRVQHAGQRTR